MLKFQEFYPALPNHTRSTYILLASQTILKYAQINK